jgi:hypothetical protein
MALFMDLGWINFYTESKDTMMAIFVMMFAATASGQA